VGRPDHNARLTGLRVFAVQHGTQQIIRSIILPLDPFLNELHRDHYTEGIISSQCPVRISRLRVPTTTHLVSDPMLQSDIILVPLIRLPKHPPRAR
jgi:hypothetical protein